MNSPDLIEQVEDAIRRLLLPEINPLKNERDELTHKLSKPSGTPGEMRSRSNDMAPPRLILTATSPDFDKVTVSNWKDEGYNVSYLPFDKNQENFLDQLEEVASSLQAEEFYAIVGVLPFRIKDSQISFPKR